MFIVTLQYEEKINSNKLPPTKWEYLILRPRRMEKGNEDLLFLSFFFEILLGIRLEILRGNQSGSATISWPGRLLGSDDGNEGNIRSKSMVQGKIREEM